MEPKYHVVTSAAISGILYAIFGSWAVAVSSFITGVLIDVDHIIDYVIVHGLHLDMRNFFSFFYENRLQKVTLVLHGWEWLLLLGTGRMGVRMEPLGYWSPAWLVPAHGFRQDIQYLNVSQLFSPVAMAQGI
jgi:hypothetical protein